MPIRSTVTVAAVLCVIVSGARSQDAQHVFQLSNSNSQRAQEIAYAVRSLLAPQTEADTNAKSITVQTSPADLAMAQWLIDALDRPMQNQELQVDQYPGASGGTNRIYVFRLPRAEPPQVFSELVNASRTVPEITEMFPVSQANAIVARADQDRLAMAEWILRQMEEPAAQGQNRREAKYHAGNQREPEVRVLFLREELPPQSFQEILNALRTVPPLTKVFPVTRMGAVAVRGDAEHIALAEWLFDQIDRPAPEPSLGSPSHDAFSGETAQIFFMPASVTVDNFHAAVNRLRTATGMTHVFPCSSTRAIVVRGTPAQLSQAAAIVRDAAQQ